MTDKLFIGTEDDCNLVRAAQDFIMDLPQSPSSGPLAVNATVKNARRAAWFAMTQSERDAIIDNPNGTDYEGWTLQYSGLYPEYSPGTRRGVFLPGDISAQISAASALGRTLTLAQATVLAVAQTVWLSDFPANWINPPP